MSYRYGHLAAHAVESVLGQSVLPDKINFYDDGVGDCKHLPDIYPEVNFILRPKNLGIITNFNDALESVDTDRVLFLGADNWLAYNAVEKLVERDEDIVTYPAWLIKRGSIEHWDELHGSSMYNVDFARAVGGYEASGNKHTEEDSMLFNKMKVAGATVGKVDSHLLLYRFRHRKNFNKD